MSGRRTVRTRPRNGLAIGDVLTAVLVSELCWSSSEFWLVTGWVTDIPVIDNAHGQFNALLGADAQASLTLSDVLALLTRRGTQLHVAVREDPHNVVFAERLEHVCLRDQLHLYSSADLHEKIMVGWGWMLKGSMNFTWNGTMRNEESLDLVVERSAAARQRLELRTRWMGSQL